MAYTIQQVVDLARVPLNDALKVRYTDAILLGYYNAAMFRLYEIRPDLQIGSYGTAYTPVAIGGIGGAIPVGDRFAMPLADYIGGRAEMKDEESVTSARAQALMQMFVAELTQ
jgi:hypothetical protein